MTSPQSNEVNSTSLPNNIPQSFKSAYSNWNVFPVKPKSKVPLLPKGYSTFSQDQLRQFRRQFTADTNVGIRCGRQPDNTCLLGLDFDIYDKVKKTNSEIVGKIYDSLHSVRDGGNSK